MFDHPAVALNIRFCAIRFCVLEFITLYPCFSMVPVSERDHLTYENDHEIYANGRSHDLRDDVCIDSVFLKCLLASEAVSEASVLFFWPTFTAHFCCPDESPSYVHE